MRPKNNRLRLTFLAVLLSSSRAFGAATPDPVELLDAALGEPTVAYHGRMMVTHWFGKQTRTEEVNVDFSPPNRYRWEFLDPAGDVERIVTSDGGRELIELVKQHKAVIGDAVKSSSKLMGPEAERDLLLHNYKPALLGGEEVAGRPTWVLELVPALPGKEHQKLWIDQETRIILDSKRYRPHGAFTVRSQFIRFQPDPDLPDSLFQTTPDTGAAVESSGLGRPDFLTMEELDRAAGKPLRLPPELSAGFRFESADFFVVHGRTIRHLRYTDGLTVLSVFLTDRPVRMPKTETLAPVEDETPGSLRLASTGRILQWKFAGQHYTLMSDISNELLERIAAGMGRPASIPKTAASAAAPAVRSAAARWSKTAGTVDSVDPQTGAFRLKDPMGRTEAFTASDATEIQRNRSKAKFRDLRPGDKIKLLRYDTRTRRIQRIVAAN